MAASVLSTQVAEVLADGAIEEARRLGVYITFATVDPGGHLKHLVRMDDAGWFSVPLAIGKAYAAAAFRRSTQETLERFRGKEEFATVLTSLSDAKLLVGPGGMVVLRDEAIIGAIGISGATSQEDEQCAHAALANLAAAR